MDKQLKYNKIASNQNHMYYIGQKCEHSKGDDLKIIDKIDKSHNKLFKWSKANKIPSEVLLMFEDTEYTPLSVTCGPSYTAVLGQNIKKDKMHYRHS